MELPVFHLYVKNNVVSSSLKVNSFILLLIIKITVMGKESLNPAKPKGIKNNNKIPFFKKNGQGNSFFKGKTPGDAFFNPSNTFEDDFQRKGKKKKEGNLPEDIREKMEKAFNADFSDVEVHENSSNAKNLNAMAYTQGNEISFAPGKYAPRSIQGQEILAHELSHVIQQRQGKVKATHQEQNYNVSDQIDLENEADRNSKIASRGGIVSGKASGQEKSETPSVQKKSNTLQLYRSLPTGATILGINPDFSNIYLACSNLAYRVENRTAGNVNWVQRIGQRLEGSIAANSLAPLSIGFTETEGINFDWRVSINWRINNPRKVGADSTTQVTRGGGGSVSLNSGTSSSSTDSASISGEVGGHEGAPGGGVELGTSTTEGSSNSQGTTLQGGVSRQGNERAQSFTAQLVAMITVSGSANFSGSDYVNPFKWGTSLGSELTTNGPQSGAYQGGTIDYQDSRPL